MAQVLQHGRSGLGTMQPADAVLVQRTLRGDTGAYNGLVLRYERQVFSLIYRMIGNADDAADLVQDTFIRAFNALTTFRQDASFLTWLYKIASNLTIDLIRSRKSKGTVSLEDEIGVGHEPAASERDYCPEEIVVRGAVAEVVHREVMNLPERYRRVVVLRHMRAMSIDEIAEELSLPSGTVKTHLFRAREMLRDRLRPVLDLDYDGRTKPP